MKALVSTVEPRFTGYRVAQVVQDEYTFPVASELFWVDCADDVVADQFWFDPQDNTIKPVAVPVIEQAQPSTNGVQTF